jgi:thioredoxin-related protein
VITRWQALQVCGIPAAWMFARLTRAQLAELPLSEDGLHIQPWFRQSFLDLKEDLGEAASSGRRLVIFWEQRGCPYCRELHRVNLADPEIATYIQTNYLALQLNLFGSREVTDFDGAKMEERQLAARWRINFTPTLCFFPATVAEVQGKSGRDAEVWRLPGYWTQLAGFEGAFAQIEQDRPQALLTFSDHRTIGYRNMIADFAAAHRLATIFSMRLFVDAGGMMSYGPNMEEGFHTAARHVARVLKGAKPSDLPVEQPTRFDLVVNLKVAKKLGITIPPLLLMRAEQVID